MSNHLADVESSDSRAAGGVLRVVLVDDSAYVRKVVRQMLSRSPFIEVVGAARDGAEALEMVEQLRPDVVVCDLIMPRMDGVGFIREQMSRRPLPIVVLSIASQGGEGALAALDAGAIDFIHKPTALATDKIFDIAAELAQKVKAAATAPMRAPAGPAAFDLSPVEVRRPPGRSLAFDLVVIGISTGGPQGLKAVIPRLPADFPVPVAVVMHMAPGYIELYTRKLDEMSQLRVKQAEDGDELRPGLVLVAPTGHHMKFARDGGRLLARLDLRPVDTPHRPAVDVLFQSAAEVLGDRVLAIVMTGMGADGRDGAAWVKAKGGRVLTEAAESCVIYGMPRSVVDAGLSDGAVTLEEMAQAIVESL
jgi:two-component system, chemotaxis family, protein-glutamate methylesterase/glutaminase